MHATVPSPASPATARKPAPESTTPHGPDLLALEDRVPDRLRASRGVALWTAMIGLLFVGLNYQPVWHTDLWGHLSYGRWIWEHGRLPETEPLMPLSRGVPFVNSAWLTQVAGYGLFARYGVPAVQMFYAATIAGALALLVAGVLRRTGGSFAAALWAMATFAVVDYQQLLIVRPQLAGLVLFVGLMTLISSRWRPVYWLIVPLLFVLWANLHGSFIVGLGLLGSCCLGRAIDVFRRTSSIRTIAANREVRRLFVLTELSAAAVLLNPYGLALYAEVLAVARHPNLQDLIEWKPLTLRMSQGKAFAACVLALTVTYRYSPRRVLAGEVLLLAGLGLAALWSSRMIVWWAPVAAYHLALHGHAIFRKRWCSAPAHSPRSGKWTVVTIGLAWIAFAITPLGVAVLHGLPRDREAQARRLVRSTSPQTPHQVVGYFQRHPPRGLIFSTYDWGDYLMWAGPRDVEVFAASHAHLIPEEVWDDYLTILHAGGGWDRKLDQYGVNVVALDKTDGDSLLQALRSRKAEWRIDFEDHRAVVFVRSEPI